MGLLTDLESEFSLPGGIMDAVWAQESSRGENMLNESSGAAGHFQMMPPNYKAAGVDPYDFEQSARWTAENARAALDMFPDMDPVEAIAKHHYGGPDTKIWGPRTRKYAAEIAERMGGTQMQVGPGNYHAAVAMGQPTSQGPVMGQPEDNGLFSDPAMQFGVNMLAAALTPGGANPLAAGVLGANDAIESKREFVRSLLQAQSNRKPSSAIQNYEYLKQNAPHMSEQERIEAAFKSGGINIQMAKPGTIPQGGREIETPGGGKKIVYTVGSPYELETRGDIGKQTTALNEIDRLMELIDTHGGEILPSEIRGEMRNLYLSIQTAERLSAGMGAPQAAEIAVLRQAMPDPNSGLAAVNPFFKAEARGAYTRLRTRIAHNLNRLKTKYGANVANPDQSVMAPYIYSRSGGSAPAPAAPGPTAAPGAAPVAAPDPEDDPLDLGIGGAR